MQDPQFGPCVMLGLGGILTEALGDVVFAAAPVSEAEARRMLARLVARAGCSRSPSAASRPSMRKALARVLTGLGRLAVERPDVRSVDVNPLIVRDGIPLAVDALVVLEESPQPVRRAPRARSDADVLGSAFARSSIRAASWWRGRRLTPASSAS